MNYSSGLVSVVLPCYNERENVQKLVVAIHHELIDFDHEILVVDDNSPDGTYRAVVEAAYPNVVPILRTSNRGFANSIRAGIEAAKGDAIVVMDSDFNHQPKYLRFMIENLEHYDCVSASRFQYGGRMQPASRHYLSWIFNIFSRLATGGMVTDSLYGFFAVKRSVLFRQDFDRIFWGYGDYCIRLFYYLQRDGITILQFPAINGERLAGVGNSRFWKVFRQYFHAVVQLVVKERLGICTKQSPIAVSAETQN